MASLRYWSNDRTRRCWSNEVFTSRARSSSRSSADLLIPRILPLPQLASSLMPSSRFSRRHTEASPSLHTENERRPPSSKEPGFSSLTLTGKVARCSSMAASALLTVSFRRDPGRTLDLKLDRVFLIDVVARRRLERHLERERLARLAGGRAIEGNGELRFFVALLRGRHCWSGSQRSRSWRRDRRGNGSGLGFAGGRVTTYPQHSDHEQQSHVSGPLGSVSHPASIAGNGPGTRGHPDFSERPRRVRRGRRRPP